jgi:hypothetical protein
MPGPPPKPADQRQRRNKRPEVVAVPSAEPVSVPSTAVVPLPPPGLLKETREHWAAYWQSVVAPSADITTDTWLTVRTLFRSLDEIERGYRLMRKERMVKGSTGQLRVNPIAGYIAEREAAVFKCIEKLGLSPADRARLGMAIGQAELTWAQVNELLNGDGAEHGDGKKVETWEGKWREA